MTDDELSKRASDADKLAWVVLTRRLFTELARTREDGFLREQDSLAQAELRALRPTEPGKRFNPATVDMASDVITQLLAGINIRPGP